MVGDSRVDIEAGRNAGMPTVAVLGGIGDEGLLRAAKPDVLIERFERLTEIL
jgi:phosphoglycolate phosphatase-like HAD superfamily hydrolase